MYNHNIELFRLALSIAERDALSNPENTLDKQILKTTNSLGAILGLDGEDDEELISAYENCVADMFIAISVMLRFDTKQFCDFIGSFLNGCPMSNEMIISKVKERLNKPNYLN